MTLQLSYPSTSTIRSKARGNQPNLGPLQRPLLGHHLPQIRVGNHPRLGRGVVPEPFTGVLVPSLGLGIREPALENRYDDGTTEPDIVLQSVFQAVDLTLIAPSAQLPAQFARLRETGGAERVPLRNQTTRGVHDRTSSAERGVSGIDELVGFTLFAELEGVVGDQLVGREAVVQLDDANVLGRDSSDFVSFGCKPIGLVSNNPG